jgi:SAM-dependent methyltransferase
VVTAYDFCAGDASKETAAQFKCKLDEHGSDKANSHNYQYVYGPILGDRDAIGAVLEIGLGTNNTDVVSNMGRSGRPGASLRAFRDFLPNARIYGADVDRRILFEEPRIQTFFVDQTDPRSFDELGKRIYGDLDLVIDDGLHSPHANIAVLSFALPRLKPGGWLIIEDIVESALPIWQVVAALLPEQEYETHLIAANNALVFAVKKNAEVLACDETKTRSLQE